MSSQQVVRKLLIVYWCLFVAVATHGTSNDDKRSAHSVIAKFVALDIEGGQFDPSIRAEIGKLFDNSNLPVIHRIDIIRDAGIGPEQSVRGKKFFSVDYTCIGHINLGEMTFHNDNNVWIKAQFFIRQQNPGALNANGVPSATWLIQGELPTPRVKLNAAIAYLQAKRAAESDPSEKTRINAVMVKLRRLK